MVKPHDKYVKQLLKAFNLDDRCGKPTPNPSTVNREDEELTGEACGLFRSGLGTMLYVSHDRMDLQYAVRLLAMRMSKPTKGAMQTLKHLILHYKQSMAFCFHTLSRDFHNSLRRLLGRHHRMVDTVLLRVSLYPKVSIAAMLEMGIYARRHVGAATATPGAHGHCVARMAKLSVNAMTGYGRAART